MPPISVQDNPNLRFASEAQEAMIYSLNLSERQQSFVCRYYQLSVQPTLSQADISHIEYIWEQAEDDMRLAEGLGLIDDWHPPCLAGEDLLSENKDMRTHLSEHIPLLAEEKLRRQRGQMDELQTENPYMTLFCPDGSGIIHMNIQTRGFVHINNDQICTRCHARFADHEKFIRTDQSSPCLTS